MTTEVDGWTLNDYDGRFSPMAEKSTPAGWHCLSVDPGGDIEVEGPDERVWQRVSIIAMAAFLELARKWLASLTAQPPEGGDRT